MYQPLNVFWAFVVDVADVHEDDVNADDVALVCVCNFCGDIEFDMELFVLIDDDECGGVLE